MQSTWQWKCKVVDNDNAKNFSGRVCSPVWLLQDWLLCQNVQVRKEEIMFFPQSSLQLRDEIFWISPPSGIWETLSRKCQPSSSSPKRSRGWWRTAAVRREMGWWAAFDWTIRKYLLLFPWVLFWLSTMSRWIRALARTPCSVPCPDWSVAGTSAARLLPAVAQPIGEDWVWFWHLPLHPCSRFDNLRDQIQEKEDDSTKYKYDNTTSQECNDLIESMESSRAIRLVLISVLHTSMVCTSLAVLAVMRIFCLLPDYWYWVCRIALYLSLFYHPIAIVFATSTLQTFWSPTASSFIQIFGIF